MIDRIAMRKSNAMIIPFRIVLLLVFASAFVAEINPARLSELILRHDSLFTSAISYTSIGDNFIRALNMGWITQQPLTVTYIGAVITALAVVAFIATFCMSFGNFSMRRLSVIISAGSALLGIYGTTILRFVAYEQFAGVADPARIRPLLPMGITVYYIMFAVVLAFAAFIWLKHPKPAIEETELTMEPKYKLFMMIMPFLVLVALFSYLPLWGWRYAFFDYRPGFQLSMEDFIGFGKFEFLFTNSAFRANIGRVMTNTFSMSGIGLATSWMPLLFAILLTEVRSARSKRVVQTLTTIPNFISWVLVYSVAFALFSSEGFINWMLINLGFIEEGTNFLLSGDNIWIKMWLWGTWKGLGWSAIIYIAGISGIDPALYEAATVDGAGRFKRIWHVTVPGLMPTFFVLLLLSISNILSNGMDQYFVFSNAANKGPIEVLDLYVYNIGIGDGSDISLATLIGMLKSLISVTLLFGANSLSKALRGESIV